MIAKLKSIMTLHLMLVILASFFCFSCNAENKTVWNNKEAAVALTYDDALVEQLENAIPVLDELDLKATFYLTGNFQGFKDNASKWKKAAENGHELGNHTLFHPCEGNAPGREWVPREYNLADYTVQRMVDEIDMTNTVLANLIGHKPRTFAYTCGDTAAGDTSFVDEIKSGFIAARAVDAKMDKIDDIDLYHISSYMIVGQSGDELISLVKKAMDQNALIVFLFHGVGGGHSLNVSLEAHTQLLNFLKENEQKVWIAPLVDIAVHVKAYQDNKLNQ